MAPIIPFIPLIAAGIGAATSIAGAAGAFSPKESKPEIPQRDDAKVEAERRRASVRARGKGRQGSLLTPGTPGEQPETQKKTILGG